MATAQSVYDPLGRLISVTYSDGSKIVYQYDKMSNRESVTTTMSGCTCPQFTVISKNASFTALDGSGSFYLVTATATITLPESAGDGSVYKFKVTGGTGTFDMTGADNIFHANGDADQNLVLVPTSGVIELISIPGGYAET